jgi:hypothetical protein
MYGIKLDFALLNPAYSMNVYTPISRIPCRPLVASLPITWGYPYPLN